MNSDSEDLATYVDHGSDAAFQRIVERHGGLVHGVASRMTQNRELAREVTQSVFIHLARKARSIRGEHLIGWLHRAARWEVKNALRKEARSYRLSQQYQQHMDANFENSTATAWNQVEPLLDDAVSKLTIADQEVILLRYFQRLSFGEIARVTGKTEEACKKRAQRSLERLRGLLQKRGVQPSLGLPALAAMIGLHAMLSAPATAAEITRIATSAAATSSSLGASILKTITIMTTKQLAAIGTVIIAIAAVSVVSKDKPHERTTAATTVPSRPGPSVAKMAKPEKPFDWKSSLRNGQLAGKLAALSAEELAAALEEVTTMDGLSKQERSALRRLIVADLAKHDPMLALNRLEQDAERGMWFDLAEAWFAFVEKDFKAADQWFHQQLEKGLMTDTEIERNLFDVALIDALNRTDPNAAFQRILGREKGSDRAELMLAFDDLPAALTKATEHYRASGDASLFQDLVNHKELNHAFSPSFNPPEALSKEVQKLVDEMPDEAVRAAALKRIEAAKKARFEEGVPLDLIEQ